MASTYLTRTFGSAGNRQSWTWSAWIKKTKIYGSSSSDREVWFGGYTASNDTDWLEFGTEGDNFYYTTSDISSEGNRLMRDPNAWFHAVVTYDGSNLKFYYNNELDFNNTSLSGNRGINVGGVHTIGAVATNQSSRRFNGLMSHVHFVDGAVLAPTVFGETDSTTGEWKIITSPTVSSYGTNGFFILKDGNSVTDQSPNSNNFTANGTLTKTEDNPSNVFCTGNPLAIKNSPIFTNGNNTIAALGSSPYDVTTLGTLGMSSGKFYYEVKWRYGGNQSNQAFTTGITTSNQPPATNMSSGSYNNVWFNLNGGDLKKNNSDVGADYPISVNSIVGFAWDLDNGTLKIHENGTYKNSGNAVVTGIPSDTYLPFFSPNGGTTTSICDLNFGNGYFGTTAVATNSGNGYQDADGNGIFNYTVPTNYRALCTKGLNQ